MMGEPSAEPFSDFPAQAAVEGLGIRQLRRVAIDNLHQCLAAAIHGHAAAATSACGGLVVNSVVVAISIYAETDTAGQIASRTQIRYAGGKICFPKYAYDDWLGLKMLVQACQPATFGLNGKEVIAETCRKAGKLSRSEFLTDFHQHDWGIIDSIRQILFPSMIPGRQGIGIGTKGVRAELYKLKVGGFVEMSCASTDAAANYCTDLL